MSAHDHTSHDTTDHTIGSELRASLTTTEDGTTECTLYPTQVTDELRTTAWITAEEGSFVDLASRR